ncbi:MAG: cytidylyltransferase domain-containing protein [Gemmatimonadota bacterium]
MPVLCVLPARTESERLPGKPLQIIADRLAVGWVWRPASAVLNLDDIERGAGAPPSTA